MYYVIQVAPHEESKVETLLRELLLNDVCRQCFHLKRRILKKYRGGWHNVCEMLLPGYVFVETDDIAMAYDLLRKKGNFSRILGMDSEGFVAMADNEVRWLECLLKYCDGFSYEIPLSKVMVRNGIVTFISGPLKDMNPLIRKINMHKRIADVHIELCGKNFSLYMGIEL